MKRLFCWLALIMGVLWVTPFAFAEGEYPITYSRALPENLCCTEADREEYNEDPAYYESWEFIPDEKSEAIGSLASASVSADFISNMSKRHYIEQMIDKYLLSYSVLTDTLRAGKPVVFFFEGGSDNCDNGGYDWSRNRTGAVCIIVRYYSGTDTLYIAYHSENCSTIPDFPLAYGAYSDNGGMGSSYGTATLVDGLYDLYSINHPDRYRGDYASFQVRQNNSAYVPAVYMKNDGSYTRHNASGINTHTRIGNSVSNAAHPWSAGCFLIGGENTADEYRAYVVAVNGGTNNLSSFSWGYGTNYRYSSTQHLMGKIVVDRYLARESLTNLYSSAGAISEIIKFSVDNAMVTSVPDTPSHINSERKVYNSEEYISFSWPSVVNATSYYVYMWKDGVELYHTYMANETAFTSAPTSPGNYTFIVRAGNDIGYSEDGASYSFIVTDTVPDAVMNLRSDKASYSTAENITFYWDESYGAQNYWIYLWKDGVQLYMSDMGLNTIYTSTPLTPGEYTLIIRPGNVNGFNDNSTSCQFTVYDPALNPTSAWISADKTSVAIGEDITFTYGATHAKEFWMGIDKTGTGRVQTLKVELPSYTTSFSEPGDYSVYVTCSNEAGGLDSYAIQFTVYDPLAITVAVTTHEATDVTENDALLKASVSASGVVAIEIGMCIGTKADELFWMYSEQINTYNYDMSCHLLENGWGLVPGIQYYYRAYAIANGTRYYGEIKSIAAPTQRSINIEKITVDNEKVAVSISCPLENTMIFCATYNNSGTMLAVKAQQIAETEIYNFHFEDASFDYVKAFIFDSNLSPLCESKRS